ncbi:snf2 family helicase [Fusarium longipes]|uniref:Snf2 family helicase n=1 Tax=Fusarium longipes TaxID=694270 RepID=A0A395RUU8_9HYPO|nr:snf2 family helicase [Fusarium longipes]
MIKIIRPVLEEVRKEFETGKDRELVTRNDKRRAEMRDRRLQSNAVKLENALDGTTDDTDGVLNDSDESETDHEGQDEGTDDDLDDDDGTEKTCEGAMCYPGDGMLPSTIRVEECHYDEKDPDFDLVLSQGILHAQNLHSSPDETVPEFAQDHQQPSQPQSQGPDVQMNFGAHRAGVITAFDPQTVRTPDNKTPAFFDSDWNNPETNLEVFVGNVNTMSVGVILHSACHLGIFLNWHLNPTIMEQNFRRIDRLGQKKAVKWVLLKHANSYHGNIERLAVQKWMVTSSTQSGLPPWMEDEILGISLYQWYGPDHGSILAQKLQRMEFPSIGRLECNGIIRNRWHDQYKFITHLAAGLDAVDRSPWGGTFEDDPV